MPDFIEWFRQREGVAPQASKWFSAFITSDHAKEVEKLFLHHQDILLTKVMIDEMEGMIEIKKRSGPEPRALLAIARTKDRLLLIKDTPRWGVKEAIRRHQEIAACTQKLAHYQSIKLRRFLTSKDEREAGDAHYTWGIVLMSNSRADPLTPAQIIDDPDRLDDASHHFVAAADDHYQNMEGTGERGGDEYAEALFRLALIVEKFAELLNNKHGLEEAREKFERAQHWFERTVFHANKKQSYYAARLEDFLRRRGTSR